MAKETVLFRGQLNPYPSDFVLSDTPAGDGFELEFADSFDEEGKATVVIVGSRNLQEFIDSFKDDVDIYNILGRVGAGEVGLLNKRPGTFIDITGLPSNIHEAHSIMLQAQQFFNDLPSDIRAKYGNNYRQFIADYGSDSFFEVFSKPSDMSDSSIDVSDSNESSDKE